MPDMNTIDEIDAELDNVFNINDTESDTVDEGVDNNEEISTSEVGQETLDDIMPKNEKTKTKEDNLTDKTSNTVKPSEPSANKSKRTNNSQDLVDANGNVIAKAGAERRFYEENVRLKQQKADFDNRILPQIKQNYNAMIAKVQAYEETYKAMQASDMTPDDVNLGIELVRQWRKSPEETLKFLLTQAKSYGINIDGQTSGIDAAAISQMMDQKLQPFIQEREEAIRQQETLANARKIHTEFYQRYPDAKIHNKELAYLYKKNPNASLDAVYWQLRNHYAENGYDFNTPLAEIINKTQTDVNKKSNFNSVNVNQNVKTETIRTPIASINKSFDQIIRETLKDHKKLF